MQNGRVLLSRVLCLYIYLFLRFNSFGRSQTSATLFIMANLSVTHLKEHPLMIRSLEQLPYGTIRLEYSHPPSGFLLPALDNISPITTEIVESPKRGDIKAIIISDTEFKNIRSVITTAKERGMF